MEMIRKSAPGRTVGMTFVMSDETIDRYGDVIEARGWALANFKKNPIALFGHSSGFPIGTWENIRVEGKQLLGDLRLAARGTSQRIDELISLVEQGILRAVSVGFRPIEVEPIDKDKPYAAQRYKRQELLETSLVSVPANPAALSIAKGMKISDDTMRLAFGVDADVKPASGRRGTTGEHAEPERSKAKSMKTLSQRIEDAQNELVAKREKLQDLSVADALDLDAVEELTAQIDVQERALAAMRASEAKLAGSVVAKDGVQSPAIIRRPLGVQQRDVGGFDLIVRRAVAHSIALVTQKSLDVVLDERYPGHEATHAVVKADQTIGTTGTAGWAAELIQTSYAAFVEALRGKSIYPELRARGIGQSFDASGTAYIPSLTAGGANGSFFAEGSPIRVGRVTTAATTMTPRKVGVIIPFSRELAKRSTPSLEAIVRQAILDDTAKVLDQTLLDATAGDTVRPAGLLNGVAAIGVGYGGGDYLAVKEDFRALLAPFITADAADGITVIMNPAQSLNAALMDGPLGNPDWFGAIRNRVTLLESTHATAGRLVALRNSDFVTATGDMPEFELSNTATIHMEDTTPLEIVSGTGPTTADPVRSFFQTDSMGIRMVMDVSWKMRRSGMVQWINGTSW